MANLKNPEPSFLRAAGAMGAATFLSRILGLAREQVFAVLFGAGNATDAFNIAFRIPNLLRDLFAEGAMSAALVPTFTRVRAQEGDDRAWRVAGLVFRVLMGIVALIALIGMLFAPQLVGLYASAYRAIPGKFELTVAMTRTMFPFFPLVALAAAYMGILNACGKFFMPAFASALFNLTSITCGVVLSWVLPHYGFEPIEGMAYGVVLGGAVQAFSQLPLLRSVGYSWKPRRTNDPVWNKDPALRQMLVLMIPGTVGLAATQVNVLVNSVLATSQAPGAVSWLNYAFRLMQFPIGIFGVSLASATLPKVSKLWVDQNIEGTSATIAQSLRHVFAINLPASAGLAFLGFPIIQMLFQYGRFAVHDTHSTAMALAAYAIGLTAYSAVKVLVPACYALGNTRVPVISSVFSVFATVILNLAMIGPFGYVGLALGTSIAAILNCVFLLYAIRRLLGGNFGYQPLLKSFLSYLIASICMGWVCQMSYRIWIDPVFSEVWISEHGLGKLGLVGLRLFKVSLTIAEGLFVILAISRIFRLTELTDALRIFTEKLRKKLS